MLMPLQAGDACVMNISLEGIIRQKKRLTTSRCGRDGKETERNAR